MAIRGSAPWVLAIVSVVALITGSILLTVTDPIAQGVFNSAMWSSSTDAGQMTLGAVVSIWTYWPLWILTGLLSLVWINTRRAG